MLLSVLNDFTNATLAALTGILHVVHVATPVGGADNAVFSVVHDGHPFNLSVISACSGVNSVVGFLLVGVAFAAVIRGPLVRKVLWLLAGMALLWTFNLGRLILVFWAGRQYGEHFAIGVLHPFIGLVLFALGVGIMLLCMRPLGLRIDGLDRRSLAEAVKAAPAPQETGNGGKRQLPVPKIYVPVLLVLLFGIIIGFGDDGLQSYNLVADVSGSPKVISYIQQPVTPVGWTSRYEATFDWAEPLFGEGSIWNRYELYPGVGGNLPARTDLVADVIDTPDLSTFEAFGVEQCYQFHGYSLAGVTQVSLTGGITGQAMSYTSQQYGSWSIVYWILPVKSGPSTVYERVVLYVENMHGLIAQSTPSTRARLANEAASGDSQQYVEAQNRNYLVAFAREMITAQANKSAPVLANRASA